MLSRWGKDQGCQREHQKESRGEAGTELHAGAPTPPSWEQLSLLTPRDTALPASMLLRLHRRHGISLPQALVSQPGTGLLQTHLMKHSHVTASHLRSAHRWAEQKPHCGGTRSWAQSTLQYSSQAALLPAPKNSLKPPRAAGCQRACRATPASQPGPTPGLVDSSHTHTPGKESQTNQITTAHNPEHQTRKQAEWGENTSSPFLEKLLQEGSLEAHSKDKEKGAPRNEYINTRGNLLSGDARQTHGTTGQTRSSLGVRLTEGRTPEAPTDTGPQPHGPRLCTQQPERAEGFLPPGRSPWTHVPPAVHGRYTCSWRHSVWDFKFSQVFPCLETF